MTQMVRKQIYIEPRQEKRLKRQASKSGVTEADIVRRGLDIALEQTEYTVRDAEAWQDELAFIRERAKMPALGKKRTWKREDVYEGRVPR